MPALEECLQRADDYLKLAGETDLVYARVALVELAAEFLELAEELARALAKANADLSPLLSAFLLGTRVAWPTLTGITGSGPSPGVGG